MPGIDLDPKLTAILQALRERELLLQAPASAPATVDFEALLDAEFWETGASGRHYSREVALRELARRRAAGPATGTPAAMSELRCRELAEDVYLLTYLLRQPERLTRRSSIWRRSGDRWTIIYHQGTLLRSPAVGS